MAIGRRTFLAATLASLAAPALVRSARAAPQFRLKLHHALSSVSSGHERFIVPWARQVEAQSNGRIRIDIFPSMQLGGQPAQMFDQARDGVADIVWTVPSHTPGRFPKIELFELPFVPSRRALVSSRALEEFAAANLQDEFREVHPICFSCADRSVLHTARPVASIAELKDLRLHVRTRFAGEAVQALGARAVPMPSAQLPLALSRHVVDGCLEPWDTVPALKLSDRLKSHTDFADSSLSTTTFVLAMNKTAYDRLPADLKAAINGKSGQVAAGMAGAMWDLQAAAVADSVARNGDHIITLMPEAIANWRKTTQPVIETWLQEMKERKIDGGKLLASAHALMTKYAGEPEPQPPPSPQQAQAQPAEAKADVSGPAKPDPPAARAAIAVKPAPAAAPTASVAPPKPPTPPTPAFTAPAAPPAPPKPSSASRILKPAPAPLKTLDIPL
jgi:TRAP-type transport system periplasmic protein